MKSFRSNRLLLWPTLAFAASACSLVACTHDHATETDNAPVGTSKQEVFANIDFEADTPNQAPASWTVTPQLYFGYGNTGGSGINTPPASLSVLDLRASPNSGFTAVANTLVLAGTTVSQRDFDLTAKYPVATDDKFRYPKYGTKSTVVNYNPGNRSNINALGRNHNANVMSATMTLAPADIDAADGQLHVRFVYAPVVQSGGHGLNQQPFAAVRLTRTSDNKVLYEDFVAASTRGAPWLPTGSGATDPYYFGPMDPADHVAGWKMVDIIPGSANVQLGDQVKVEIIAAGCYATAHWGRVYLDSFGLAIPDLYVVAKGVQAANQNTDITYTYTYKNGGTGTATNAFVDFAIPTGTTFVSVDIPGCTVKTFADPRQAAGLPGGPFPNIELHTCPIGDVAPGGSGSFHVVAHVDPNTQGQTDVNGHYSSYASNVDPLVGPDIRTVITNGVSYSDVSAKISSGLAAAGAGEAITYTATVENSGPTAGTNVNVSVTATNATLGNWTCAAAGGATCASANGTGPITANGVSIPVGGKLTYTITATAGAVGTAIARVDTTVNAPNSDSDLSNNSATELLQVGTVRDVKVTKGNLGTVRSAPASIDCGTGCTEQTRRFLDGSTVILEATPPAGGSFLGWTGACSGTSTTCSLTANANLDVGARFVGPLQTVTATGGDNQSTAVTTAFAQPLSLKAVDSEGTGIPNLAVTFTPPGAGSSASLTPASTTTDANGAAQTTATANAIAGSFVITGSIGGKDVAFNLRSVEPPGSITVISGAPQQKVVGNVFDQPVVIEVRDWANAPRKNAIVRFAGPTSGASAWFTTPLALTGADGRVSVPARANFVAGTYNVGVSVDNTQMPASLGLTNLPGAPALVRVIDGADRQAAKVGTAFARPIKVHVTDAYGNAIPGATVDFAGPTSEPRAALGNAAATTNTTGDAEVPATAGAVPGAYLVTASVNGTKLKADFVLENTALSPIVVKTVSGTPQTTPVNVAFGAPLKVVVTRDNQPLKDIAVSFAKPATGASATLSGFTVTTDSSGFATVTATGGTKAGAYEVLAFTPGGQAPALFALANTAGAPSAITADPQTTPQNAKHDGSFAQPLRALVTDAFGNPVSGATVTYAVPGSAPTAQLDQATAVTDAAGYVTVKATAGTVLGKYQVNATVGGVTPPAVFDLGNLANDALFLQPTSGTPQSIAALAPFTAPLVVTAFDALGNTAAGVNVTFAAPADLASATLGSPTGATDGSGTHSTAAVANPKAGEYLVIATANDAAAPAPFMLANTPASAASIVLATEGNNQSAYLGKAYPQKLRATLVDASGNPVSGVDVAFVPPSSGPTALVSTLPLATDANGAIEAFGIAARATGTFDLPVQASGGINGPLRLTNLEAPPPAPTPDGGTGSDAGAQADGGARPDGGSPNGGGAAPTDDGSLEGGGFSCSATTSPTSNGAGLLTLGLGLVLGVARRIRRRR